MSSSGNETLSPELGESSSNTPNPLESGQTEYYPFTTPTKKCLRQNLTLRSQEKGFPPGTDLGASGSQDLPSDSDSESDESEDDLAKKKIQILQTPVNTMG